MKVCALCYKEAGGFGFIKPPLRAGYSRNSRHRKYFCSRNCQEIFSKLFKKNEMIDITKMEKEAIESTLKPLGKFIAEIGMDRPVSSYTREEALCLAEIVVTAYQEFMQSKEDDSDIISGGKVHA